VHIEAAYRHSLAGALEGGALPTRRVALPLASV
jgi:hypothetical protein